MKTLLFLLAGCCFSYAISAEPRPASIETIDKLNEARSYNNMILTLPDTEASNETRRYLALPPDTRQVLITPQAIKYDEEAESFARHRRHYIAFWTLFLSMLGLDILWAE